MTDVIVYSTNDKLTVRIKEIIEQNYIDINMVFFSNITPELKRFILSNNRLIYIICLNPEDHDSVKLAEEIRKNDFDSIIIFVISYGLSAFYLAQKKFMFLTLLSIYDNFEVELLESLDIAHYILKNKDIFTLSTANEIYFIKKKEILYINSLNQKTYVHLVNKEIETTFPLKNLTTMLKCRFIQSHKSCYVNVENVHKIDFKNNSITFNNSSKIDLLSRRYKSQLKESLDDYKSSI